MTVLAFAVIVVACAVMVWLHRRLQKQLAQRLVDQSEALEGQRDAQHKQAKAFQRDLARTERAAAKTIDSSRATVDEARQINQQMHAFFRDPRVQRFLDN